MNSNTKLILSFLKIVAWFIFIALCFETGALLFNFIFSFYQPIATEKLYKYIDLSNVFNGNVFFYIVLMTMIIIISLFKSILFYFIIKLFYVFNINLPFNLEVAKKVETLSYFSLIIGISCNTTEHFAKTIEKEGFSLGKASEFWDDGSGFLMSAAIIFIIAQVLKKGVKLQQENDLTI